MEVCCEETMKISNIEISITSPRIFASFVEGRERESMCALIVVTLIKRGTGGIMSRVKRNRITFACLNPRVERKKSFFFSLTSIIHNSLISSYQIIIPLSAR